MQRWIARLAAIAIAAGSSMPAAAQDRMACIAAPIDADAIPALARAALATYRETSATPDPAVLFRMQLLAGREGDALASIDAARAARGDAGGPPLFLQYEVHARAHLLQRQRGLGYARAWRQAFRERFGALDDAAALGAEFSFGSSLPRMQSEFDAALAQARGQRCLPLAQALALLRAAQVRDAYAAFLPLFDGALREDDARRYLVDRDAMVRTPDGGLVAVLVVRPARGTTATSLLQFTIYANDGWAWGDAKKMASRGYAGVYAYTRGKGRSPDAIEPFLHDGADAAATIDWIAAQPWSDGRVGMYGGSYSGFTQWAALKHAPKALKAIAASATVAPGIDVPMEGGAFLNFMYPWPVYVASNRALNDADYGDATRWRRLDRDWYASGRAYRDLPAIDGTPNGLFAQWLRHPAYDAYWSSLIPQGDAVAGIDIPVLATTGYFDGGQIGVLHYFREHLRHRPDADHTLLIGPFEHLAMQTGVPAQVQGYTVDPVARIDLQALRLDWFDHVFKGKPKPALLADRVNWQAMGADAWRHAPTLEAMATRTRRFYLVPGNQSGRGLLADAPQPTANSTQRVDFGDRGDADWTPSPLVLNAALDPRLGLAFASAPMPADTEFAGPFHGVLDFIVNKRDVDIAIGVYEQDAAGNVLDLAFWVQRASYNADRRQRRLLQAGTPQRLVVDETRLLGRRLAAGSRLVVTVGVIKQPDRQLNLGSGKEPSDETVADAGAPLEIRWRGSSYLEFGIRG